jgi:hypothetical protein
MKNIVNTAIAALNTIGSNARISDLDKIGEPIIQKLREVYEIPEEWGAFVEWQGWYEFGVFHVAFVTPEESTMWYEVNQEGKSTKL